MTEIIVHPLYGTDGYVLLRHVGASRTARIDCRGMFCRDDAYQLGAAPELFKALTDLVALVADMTQGGTCWQLATARDALRKARGEGEAK